MSLQPGVPTASAVVLTSVRTEVLTGPIRAALIDIAAQLSYSEVARVFQDEGFGIYPGAQLARREAAEPETGRLEAFLIGLSAVAGAMNPRTVAEQYLELANGRNPVHVVRVLHAVEELLWLHQEKHGDTRDAERLRRHLQREGYEIDEHGRIRLPARLLPVGTLAAVRSPHALDVLLARVEHVLPDDPMLAIGTAKELIEATCHTVLAELSRPVAGFPDLPDLVYRTESALAVHPQHADGMDGVPQVRALLGRLTAITNELAALRNQAGSGHGRAGVPEGLAARHGRLALNAAFTWCRFILDTLADPNAAWTRSSAPPPSRGGGVAP